MQKSTYCLEIAATADKYDVVIAGLYEAGMLGCEENTVAGKIQLKAFFNNEKSAQDAGLALKSIVNQEEKISEIAPQDWIAKWRHSMKPARLARGWWVSPVWLPPPKTAGHWIKIEPKMAFGTGHHETTRLAASAIIALKQRVRNKRMLDIGTGSGVLCFVAARCGAASAIGLEIDPYCTENLAENRDANRSDNRIGFIIGSINAIKCGPAFDGAVMNMILTESTPLLDTITALLRPDGFLIWSGILTEEHEKAVALAGQSGFCLKKETAENEWWCGVFERNKKVRGTV